MNITLREAHQRHGLAKMIQNPHWVGWMLHTRWLSLFPRDWDQYPIFLTKEGREMFVKIGRSPAIRDLFLASLVPEDDEQKAIAILTEIAQTYPEKLVQYRNLAIAYSIVFDQPFPKQWPHPFVESSKIPVGNSDPKERFAFYVAAQEAKDLVLDIRRVGVQDLTFLVDAPIPLSEFKWAQQINISSPNRLALLYPKVPYNTQRIESKQYKWPGPSYQLGLIGNEGGICMDQAYLVSMTGKSKGIPTLLFTGQGLSGDHGWVGYLGKNNRWEMEVAKYGEHEYPIGQAYDPQTWQRITDAELQALQKGADFKGVFGTGHKLLQWCALNEGQELYPEILRAARISLADDPRPWQLEADFLEESSASAADRLRFWNDWSQNFARNADMLVKGEMRRIALLEEMNRTTDAEKLRKSLMSGNKSKRFDLGIAIAAEPVFRKLRLKDFEAAEKAYESAMRKFRTKAGGHLYYNLLKPYIVTCIQEGQVEMAKDGIDFVDKGFQVTPGTMLDQDMKALIERVKQL